MRIQRMLCAAGPDAATREYRLAPDVVLVLIDDGSARLLDLAGHFYTLSPTATAMLEETLQADEDAAVTRISARFAVDPLVVRADLRPFLANLEREKLIGRSGQVRQASSGGLAFLGLRPALAIANRLPVSSALKAKILLGLAHFFVRRFGWAATVAAWRRCLEHAPTERRDAGCRVADEDAFASAADDAIRTAAARHFFHIECKERALACWSMLRWRGLPARLIVGIDPFPFATHCWCELGTRVLSDFADRCERFTPVMTYS